MRKTANYLIVFFALTAVVAVVFAIRAQQRVAELESEIKKAANDKAAWEKQLADARQHMRDLEAQLAASRERVAGDALADAGPNGDGPPDRPGRGGRRNGGDPRANFMALMDNPEVAKLWSAQQRSQLDGQYAALFKNLKLSPADLEKFKNLLVEKQDSMRDVMSAARAQGLDPRQNRDEIRQLVTQANAELDASIQATLGPDGFSQYKQYEQTLPQRNVVSQLDQRLSYSGTPLNSSQSDQLVQILAQNAPARQDPMSAIRPNGGPNRVPITDQAVAQASSVLTPDQVTALQQLQSEQQAQRKLFESLRNAEGNAPSPGGANAGSGASRTPAPTPKPSG